MNNNSENVSIIIPCYNAEKYIERTIKSVINQTAKNIEIVIVDDGSTDNTIKCIEDIMIQNGNDNYKIIKQKNQGVSIARNKGIDNSSGDYIFFLDSDDFIEETCIEQLYKKSIKDNLDLVICGYDYVDENSNHSIIYDKLFKYIDGVIDGNTALKLLMKREINIWTCSCMYKKDIIDKYKLRYYPNCNFGEDIEFIYKSLFNSKRVGSVNQILSHYFQSTTSLSHKFSIDHFKSLGAYNRIKKYFEINEANDELINSIIDKFNYEPIIIYNRYIASGLNDANINLIFDKMNTKYKNRISSIKLRGFSKIKIRMYVAMKIFTKNYKIYKMIYKKIYT